MQWVSLSSTTLLGISSLSSVNFTVRKTKKRMTLNEEEGEEESFSKSS